MLTALHTTSMLAACALMAACSPSEAPETVGTPSSENVSPVISADQPVTPEPTARAEWLMAADIPAAAISADGGIARDADGRPLGYSLLGETFPAISGTLVDGTPFSTADLGGRWTVVDVWGIWCGDCMADAPYVAALATALAQDPDVDFLSIHTPPSAERADEAYGKYGSVSAYFDAAGYSYPTLVDTDASVRGALRIDWTPTYLLVGPDLRIHAFRTDLSVAGNEPVKDTVRGIADVRRTAGQ